MADGEKFELKYDAAAVRQSLREARERRGVKVSHTPMPHVGRVGKYIPQSEKRKAYHGL